MNIRLILSTLGRVLFIEAACLLLPLLCSIIYKEAHITDYLVCIAICVLVGSVFVLLKPKNKNFYSKEGFVTVALSWIIISVFGAFPFMRTGFVPNFFDAFFETASGFSTTGASILSDVEALPKSLLLWRSFTNWIGGMGVLVFLVAIVSLSGGSNVYLIKAESPGPSVSKLVPKVKEGAKILYTIYLGLTALEFVMLIFDPELDWFCAITTTFSNAGTGGFGILNSSIAEYSKYSQTVITVFMLLFGVDFSIYYLILLGKFKSVLKSDELKAYIGIVVVAIAIITVNCLTFFGNLKDSLHHSAFQVASIMTTTGFSTMNFDMWPSLSKNILVMLMFIGGCAGSTAGGMKVSRIILLLKSIVKEVKIMAHPRTTFKTTMNGRVVEHETIRAVNVFTAVYFVIFFSAILLISFDNFDFTTNFTAVAATINNIGPGLNMVGPTQNFSWYSDFSTFVLSMVMLIGRLEIFPMLMLFAPTTWRK